MEEIMPVFDQSFYKQFYFPWPSTMHPDLKKIHEESFAWVKKHHMISEKKYQYYDKQRPAWLVARSYPTASFDVAKLACDTNYWFFIYDDVSDVEDQKKDAKVKMQEYQEFKAILYGGTPDAQAGPFATSLFDIVQRFKKMSSKKTFDRFIKDMDDYLLSMVWESEQRQDKHIPDVKTYIEKRALTGAMLAEFDFIELAQNCQVPDEILDQDPFKSVVDKANNAINWFNDINGIKRDFATGSVYSLVAVIKYQYNLSWKDALQKAVEMHNDEVKAFINLAAKLPSFGPHDDSVHKYIAGLTTWLRGHFDWEVLDTSRYNLNLMEEAGLCVHDEIKYGDPNL